MSAARWTQGGAGRVAALYVRADGPYAGMRGVDAWTAERDARTYTGPGPVVAHPPCGAWGRYAHIYKRSDGDCGPRAVEQVRAYRGVLEHPADSKLWPTCVLPAPGDAPDEWGGWSIRVEQGWWGHRAPKPTWLYLVGVPADAVRAGAPDWWHTPPAVANRDGRRIYCEALSQRQRELTPPAFAAWLVSLARCAAAPVRQVPRAPGAAAAAGGRTEDLAGQLSMFGPAAGEVAA